MKFLFDENLSYRILTQVRIRFPGSAHLKDLDLLSASDNKLWDYASEHAYVIVTKDSDFYQRSMLEGYPPKIIWLNVGNKSTEQILQIFFDSEAAIINFIKDTESSLLIIKE